MGVKGRDERRDGGCVTGVTDFGVALGVDKRREPSGVGAADGIFSRWRAVIGVGVVACSAGADVGASAGGAFSSPYSWLASESALSIERLKAFSTASSAKLATAA